MFGILGRMLEKRVPTDMRISVQRMLDFAGDDTPPEKWVADTILISITTTLVCLSAFIALSTVFEKHFSLVIARFFEIAIILIAISAFVLAAMIRWLLVSFKIDDRKRKCQEILPDFLSVVAMNISAGMEPLAALYVSLRPDFDPITTEMRKLRSLALGSKSIVDQLSLLKTRIDSVSLRTTVAIIERASLAGGDLAMLLSSISQDLRENNKIQKELETATKGYITFITFLAIFGVPLLLSAATLFLSIITVPNIASGLTSMLAVSLSGKPIPVSQIEILFLVLIVFSSISASFIFSVLWRGEIKQGAKYIPLMVPASIAVFFFCQYALRKVLGTFIGFV
ncbi:MAG: type II secretion system F family protein [Candidatus Micrarchaeia archaeon]